MERDSVWRGSGIDLPGLDDAKVRGQFLVGQHRQVEEIHLEQLAQVAAHARALMENEGMAPSAAAREAAKGTPFAKSQVYRVLMGGDTESEDEK